MTFMAFNSAYYRVRVSAVLRAHNLCGLVYQSTLIRLYWSNVSRISHQVAPVLYE